MDRLRERITIKHELGRALLGEFVGTALLLLVGTSVVAQALLGTKEDPLPTDHVQTKEVRYIKLGGNQMIGINIGFGLAIAFGVAVCARLSGGHINPAVSLMFLSFRQLAPVRFVLYCLAQTAGAFFGAALTYLVYYDAINEHAFGKLLVVSNGKTAGIFASYPGDHLGVFNGLIDQIVATAVFCFCIAHITDKRNYYPSWTQPLLVGTSFVMIGAAFGFNCGYPVNPARDFGPRLFTFLIGYGGDVFSHGNKYISCWFWIPIIGPFIGALIGAWFYQFAIGFHTPTEIPEVEVRKYEVSTTQELKPLTTAEKDGREEA